MKVTLTKVTQITKDKNGAQLVSKDGKPYTRLLINTQEHGDKPLSGFKNKGNANWQPGEVVEIEVSQNGEYLNFKNLSAVPGSVDLSGVLKRLSSLEETVKTLVEQKTNEQFDDEIPFE